MEKMDLSHAQSHRLRDMGDKAHQGEEVVIMRDGQPWLRLTPCPDYTPPPPPPPRSYDQLQTEWQAKMTPEEKAFWFNPKIQETLTELVTERWTYLPERELCVDCLAKSRRQNAPVSEGSP